jgi:transposase|tara:strand:- start:137 stop:496 length:360 start_codon:yes stop_codon:yes gene_type:complete
MATLSTDLRERIVTACDNGEGTRQDIAERYNVSLGMVKKLLQQRRRIGDIGPLHSNSGAKPKITVKHERKLRRLVDRHPDKTLEELRDALGVSCTPQAIHYALERMGLPLKKRRSTPPN